MSTTTSRTLGSLDPNARRVAERAARRAGMTLEDWLRETILERADVSADEEGVSFAELQSGRSDEPLRRGGAESRWHSSSSERRSEVESLSNATLDRLEQRFALNEERTTLAFESIALLLERATAEAERQGQHASTQTPGDESPAAAVEQFPVCFPNPASPPVNPPEAPLASAGDMHRREKPFTEESAPQSGAKVVQISADDLHALHNEIDGTARSLTDLAPRNAVVALEGAVKALSHRVALLRENGRGKNLLAPLDDMASDLRAALKTHDIPELTALLESEIHAVAAKIDNLTQKLVDPAAFESIRIQTQEVRDLLAAVAMRTTPVEALERQICELADGIEKLAASPAPHIESAEMAASLDELRREIVRNAPTAALASIEQRLELIAARLDEETARAHELVVDPRPLDDLAHSLEGIRQSLEARAQAPELADSDAPAIKPLLAELIEKLDRLPEPEANEHPIDVRAIETGLEALNAKLEIEGSLNEKTIAKLADKIAQRIEDRPARFSADAIAQAHRRPDAFARRSDEPESLAREGVDKLRDAGLVGGAERNDTRSNLALYIAEFRSEHANADRRIQARLATLQSLLEQPTARLAKADTAPRSSSCEEQPQQGGGRKASEPILRSVDMLGIEDGQRAKTSHPALEPSLEEGEPTLTTARSEDFLLEPGAGAPHWAKDAGESAQTIGSKTNPAVTAHIAAARRAAQAALAESGVKTSGAASSSGVAFSRAERAKTFYTHHRRSVLLAIALAVVAASAARMVVLHPPFSLRLEVNSAPEKATSSDAPSISFPWVPSAMAPDARPVDTTPTASITSASEALKPLEIERASPNLILDIPMGVPQSLRDAIASGRPDAQYELAQRLVEGRGVPQNQKAAAQWFERAASAGFAPAQFHIGMMYEKGIGVLSDRAAARRWYFQAAESGNARAAHNLAVMYAEPPDDKPDYAQAAKWFRKAGELGVRDSQFNLGVLYARGLGVPQDLGQSWLWFSLAAAQGDADAEKKRDEVASKMDPAALAAAAEALSKFKVSKPDPVANEAAAAPGGLGMKPPRSDQSLMPLPAGPKSEKAM